MSEDLEKRPLTFPEIMSGLSAILDTAIKTGKFGNEQNLTYIPESRTDKYHNASAKSEQMSALDEFDDDLYDGNYNVRR